MRVAILLFSGCDLQSANTKQLQRIVNSILIRSCAYENFSQQLVRKTGGLNSATFAELSEGEFF